MNITKERLLLKIAKLVEALPPEKLDMRTWCGTSCCAIGWAYKKIPAIKKAFVITREQNPQIKLRADRTGTGLCAVAEYFGITHAESVRMFVGGGKPPAEVAAKIREVVGEARARREAQKRLDDYYAG